MVAIARALLLRPSLLIMDEPSTGLAPKVVKDILQTTRKLRQRGMGLLLVEQNVGIAEITDWAYVMARPGSFTRLAPENGRRSCRMIGWQTPISEFIDALSVFPCVVISEAHG